MANPWDSAPAEHQAQPTAKPWESAAPVTDAPQDSGFRTLPGAPFPTRQIDLGNGKTSEQRQDGAVWFGAPQGNKGGEGWFNAQGQKMPDTLAPKPGWDHPIARIKADLIQANDAARNDMAADAKNIRSKSWLGQLTPPSVAGMTQGTIDTITAPAQLVTHAMGSNVMDAPINALEQNYQQNFVPSAGGRAVGQALPTIATMGATAPASAPAQVLTTAQKVKAALATIGKSAGTGAVVAPVLTPETNVQNEGDYWKRKGIESAVGGATGLVMGGLGYGAPAAVDAWAAKYRNPQAAKLLTDLEAANVPMSASEIATATKAAPEQVTAAEEAVRKLSNTLKKQMDETPFAGIDDVRAAAKGSGSRANAAQAILDEVDKNPKDAESVLKTSGGLAALREKMRMDQLASARDTLAAGVKGPLTDAAAAVDKRIEALSLDLHNNPDANKGEIAALQDLKQRFLGTPATDHLGVTPSGSAPVVIRNGTPIEQTSGSADHLGGVQGSPVVIRNGQPTQEVRDIYGTVVQRSEQPRPVFESGGPGVATISGTPKPSIGSGPSAPRSYEVPTFQQASATRANLNDVISGLYKGNNAVTGQADAATLQAIKNGLNSDMSRMAEESGKPALAAADRTFRSEYSKYSGTFKDPTIVKAITSEDPSVVIAGLAKAGPEKAQRVFDALDPKGQAAYAVGTFNQALKDAANPRTGDWIPGNVAMGFKKAQAALGVTIKDPALRTQMDSTLNVLQALAKSNPEQASALGQRITGSIMQASDKLGAIATLYEGVKDYGMDLFFNTRAGRDFLFKSKGLSPSSPEMGTLIKQETPFILASAQKTLPKNGVALPTAASTESSPTLAEKQQ